ncbi:hypothetical protein ACWDUI_13015 [Streptosporangium sandarakinum]|uniref:hypothetical protein n=1 Tax=Streptosporangium TaxID=2000 RepID=UPI0031F83413
MFERFTPEARRTVVRAGLLSLDAGRTALDDDMLLLALAEAWPVGGFAVSPDAVRALLPVNPADRPGDRDLLAGLGIDLDEIRRRLPARRADPAAWRLRRPRTRPLRVTLSGPAGDLRLTVAARKAVEVALHHGARRTGGGATDEDLVRGLLADGSGASAAILRRLGVDLHGLAGRLWPLRASA